MIAKNKMNYYIKESNVLQAKQKSFFLSMQVKNFASKCRDKYQNDKFYCDLQRELSQ